MSLDVDGDSLALSPPTLSLQPCVGSLCQPLRRGVSGCINR
ncbi:MULTISPECIES: hypothetical protein [Shewanella]|nr:hypothetical protein [Shewanella fodinae]